MVPWMSSRSQYLMPTSALSSATTSRPALRLAASAMAAAVLAASLALGLVHPAVSTSPGATPIDITTWLQDPLARDRGAVAHDPASPTAPDDGQSVTEIQPPPRSGAFGMNLYRQGDFVSQHTEYWCVVASVQTMMNIMEPGTPDRSRATQRSLQFQARRLDQDDDDYWRARMSGERWRKGYHGLGLQDWVGLLNANGFGPYEIDRAETRKHAIRKAARAIRLTGKPAGLVVWRGAHAWVMSGFEATADPAYTNQFKVRRVSIQDPWYPAVSSLWGASRPPNASVSVRALDQDFLRYDRPGRRHPKRDGKYMLILPTVPTSATS
jgi:hypothetical protein